MKNLSSKEKNAQQEVDTEIFSNPKYICKLSGLIGKSLQNGHDVMQLPNGDVITTITKTVTTQYSWCKNKEKFIQASPRV